MIYSLFSIAFASMDSANEEFFKSISAPNVTPEQVAQAQDKFAKQQAEFAQQQSSEQPAVGQSDLPTVETPVVPVVPQTPVASNTTNTSATATNTTNSTTGTVDPKTEESKTSSTTAMTFGILALGSVFLQ